MKGDGVYEPPTQTSAGDVTEDTPSSAAGATPDGGQYPHHGYLGGHFGRAQPPSPPMN